MADVCLVLLAMTFLLSMYSALVGACTYSIGLTSRNVKKNGRNKMCKSKMIVKEETSMEVVIMLCLLVVFYQLYGAELTIILALIEFAIIMRDERR